MGFFEHRSGGPSLFPQLNRPGSCPKSFLNHLFHRSWGRQLLIGDDDESEGLPEFIGSHGHDPIQQAQPMPYPAPSRCSLRYWSHSKRIWATARLCSARVREKI